MIVKKIRKVSENDCRTLNKISEILQHSITLLLYKPPPPLEDNDRTIISGLLFYSTAVLDALETNGASEAGSALKAVAADIDKITFSLYWKKELTDLQVRIMAQ
ncbi:hypothetical protein G9A89_023693 [Geosiphon pyriformis]|nr:hypothetical protein G9A89_023693 [Geosiphon pyriformis]